MKYLRNIKPYEVIKITEMIGHAGKSILRNGDTVRYVRRQCKNCL